MKGMSRDDQPRSLLGRLYETGLHFDGDAAARFGIKRPPGHRHGHVEHRHDDAAMRHRPAVEMPRGKIKRQYRPAVSGTDELDTKLLDEGDLLPNCAALTTAQPHM